MVLCQVCCAKPFTEKSFLCGNSFYFHPFFKPILRNARKVDYFFNLASDEEQEQSKKETGTAV